MGLRIRASAVVLVLVSVSLFAVLMTSPNVAAASRTWTTDADFNEAGAVFLGTEVVGTGVPAAVELIRSTTDWANENPSSPTPGPLWSPSFAFDEVGGGGVLFGGYNGGFPNSYSDKTWEYNWGLNTWTEVQGDPHPSLRQSAALSYDPVEQVMVLFGGFNDSDFLTDTWEYDVATNTWAEISTSPSPPMMASYTLVYHASASRHLMVGSDFSQNVVLWAYDAAGNTWVQRFPSGTPSPRSGFAVAYHSALDVTVLHGGTMFTTLYSDTFEYNYPSNSWTPTASGTPSARGGHAMTYRVSDSSVVLFGGLSGAGKLQDSWRYTELGTWEPISTANRPSARNYHAMTYDRGNDVVLLYGGVDTVGDLLGDTWSLGAAYGAAGRYRSAVFNAGGASVNWDRLYWNQTPPAPHILRFQIATSLTAGGAYDFVGPDGAPNTYYTSSGTPIYGWHDGRQYLKFLADFGSFDTQFTPSMKDVYIGFVVPPADPCIVYTIPKDATEFNYPMTADVTIGFSEEMNTSSLDVTFILPTNPPYVTFIPSWNSPENNVVVLTHLGDPFRENTPYRLLIAATDLDGTPLSATCPGGAPAAPNPFIFVTEKIPPYITETTPPNDYGFDPPAYPITSPIYVEFIETMKTTSVTLETSPPASFTHAWTNVDKNLSATPGPPLLPCTKYTVWVNGTDLANLPLIPGPVPNPWVFYSECKDPYLVATSPMHFQLGVDLNAPIILDFSEPMLTSSVSVTVIVNYPPPPAPPAFSWTWSNGNRRYTGTHAAAFPICEVYTVTVTGTDVEGNPLVPNPADPTVKNPFKFMTDCDRPSIMVTDPEDGEVNVPQGKRIDVAFSVQMNEGTVTWDIEPDVMELTPSWDASVFLHIPHTGFRQCTQYTVTVSPLSQSLTGQLLVEGFAPNPWSFETICEAPYITDTYPANDSFLIPLDTPIWVNFSEPMNPDTVINITVPGITLTETWSNGDRTLRLDHATPFTECQRYDMFIDGTGADGNDLLTGAFTPGAPNPWHFTTICIVPFPYIILTDPADGEQNVPLNKSIVVDFSEAINTSTFDVNISPNIAFEPPIWTNGDTRVTLVHTADFPECAWHTLTITAEDLDGNPLGDTLGAKPNPWMFKTRCLPPQILFTDPVHDDTNVSLDKAIVVTFSEAMNPASPPTSWSIFPSITLTRSWSVGNTVLTLSHSAPFQTNTRYCIEVFGQDVGGNSLEAGSVPNPWCFTTGSGLPAPRALQVIRVCPDIRLQWQSVSGAAGYRVYTSTNRFNTFPTGWSFTDVMGTMHNYTSHCIDGLFRYYIVRARDSSGGLSPNSTMGSKVPLTFSFATTRSNVYWISLPYRSMYDQASDVSDELTSVSIDVVAKWDAATQTSILWFFFRNEWRGENFPINPGDAIWIGVRRAFSWIVTGTDFEVNLTFDFHPAPSQNIHWVSLPHTSRYQRASDIVKAIEGNTGGGANTKIVEVAKWDGSTQQYVRFQWSSTGWTGQDFVLASGEAIYLRVVSTFTWAPQLLTPEVP